MSPATDTLEAQLMLNTSWHLRDKVIRTICQNVGLSRKLKTMEIMNKNVNNTARMSAYAASLKNN